MARRKRKKYNVDVDRTTSYEVMAFSAKEAVDLVLGDGEEVVRFSTGKLLTDQYREIDGYTERTRVYDAKTGEQLYEYEDEDDDSA